MQAFGEDVDLDIGPRTSNPTLRVERIWEGTSEIQRKIVADQLAKRGARMLSG